MADEIGVVFRDVLTASANSLSFDDAEIKGPVRIRYVKADLTAFLVGGARLVSFNWAGGPVASQDDLDKEDEGNFAAGLWLGGQGGASLIAEVDVQVMRIKHIVCQVLSIDSTDRLVTWEVIGHGASV